MTINCTAVYKKGVLRLKEPISLRDGAEVDVIVITDQPASAPEGLAAALAAIAALPLESDDQGFSGQDHDEVLYGEHGAR